MISTNKRRLYGEVYNDVRCLSTDEKPKDVKNGSTLVEIDTGDVYMFDAEGVTWNQLPSSGGGGGGPQPASVVPLMDGVANAGSSEKYARADHIHPTDTSRASTAVATTSANGLMSATDKRKLGGIESGANAYTLPTMTATTKGGAKLGDGLTITDGALGIDPEPQESTGEVRGAIASLTAKGWATQTQTTGKNLAKPNPEIADGSFSDVVCTYLGNGVWRMVGTNDADSANTRAFKMFDLGVLPAGTYCATFEMVSGSSDSNIIARIGTGSNATYYSGFTNVVATPTKNVRTFTTDGSNQYWVCMQLSAHATVDGVFRLQVESGSTATSYEPYTGGAPSPSPDYPQEIQVARGRNLLNKENVTNGYHINNSGVPTVHTKMFYSDYIEVAELSQYVLHGKSSANGPTVRVFVSCYDASKTWKSGLVYTNAITPGDSYEATFTVPSGAKYVVVSRAIEDTDIQLELGSTPTPYVPYGHVGAEVDTPSIDGLVRLIPRPQTKTLNGVTVIVGTDGVIRASGTATANGLVLFDLPEPQRFLGDLNGWYIHLRNTAMTGSSTHTRFVYYNGDTMVGYLSLGTANRIVTLAGSTVSGKTFDRVGIEFYVGNVCNGVIEPTLEQSSTAVPFVNPFTTTIPVPLPSKGFAASLPDGTADVLTIDGAGKVEWESTTGMVTLDGSETWTYRTNETTGNFAFTPLAEVANMTAGQSVNRLLSSHFTINNTNLVPDVAYVSGTNFIVKTGTGFAVASAEGAKAWMAANNTTVLYPLATPATEQVGYINWPSIPDGATITCPELDALGVRYLIGNGVSEMARDWYERGHSEAQATSTALGELAQSVLDVDGKADAVAAQLVAEDVSDKFYFRRSGEPQIVDGTGHCMAYKALGFVWFNFEFEFAAGTILQDATTLIFSDDNTVYPHRTLSTNTIAAQTNIPKVKAHIFCGYYGPTFYLVPQESSVTVAGGDTVYSISGIYYVG